MILIMKLHVICRIASLETSLFCVFVYQCVICRIGSLEILIMILIMKLNVIGRIGSLETVVPLNMR